MFIKGKGGRGELNYHAKTKKPRIIRLPGDSGFWLFLVETLLTAGSAITRSG